MTESDPLPADLRAVIAREARGLFHDVRLSRGGIRLTGVEAFGARIARLAWEARGHTEDDPDDISSSETPVHAWTDEQLTEMRRIARAHDLRHARRSLEAAGYTILPPSPTHDEPAQEPSR